jgi:hypothetical protein
MRGLRQAKTFLWERSDRVRGTHEREHAALRSVMVDMTSCTDLVPFMVGILVRRTPRPTTTSLRSRLGRPRMARLKLLLLAKPASSWRHPRSVA